MPTLVQAKKVLRIDLGEFAQEVSLLSSFRSRAIIDRREAELLVSLQLRLEAIEKSLEKGQPITLEGSVI